MFFANPKKMFFARIWNKPAGKKIFFVRIWNKPTGIFLAGRFVLTSNRELYPLEGGGVGGCAGDCDFVNHSAQEIRDALCVKGGQVIPRLFQSLADSEKGRIWI